MARTRGCGGATKRWRRPMVLNRRYARLRLASACTTKGLRCMKGRRSTICSSAAAGSDLRSIDMARVLCLPRQR